MEQIGLSPDGFATFKTGGDVKVAIEWVRTKWPDAELIVASREDDA